VRPESQRREKSGRRAKRLRGFPGACDPAAEVLGSNPSLWRREIVLLQAFLELRDQRAGRLDLLSHQSSEESGLQHEIDVRSAQELRSDHALGAQLPAIPRVFEWLGNDPQAIADGGAVKRPCDGNFALSGQLLGET